MEGSGRVELRFNDDDSEHAVRVQALGPAEAAQRAVRQVLSGQPRRADRVYEVTVTLTKGDS